jgi:prepilin-type N-terminal cleavage/methylation domain-containing protein/prepilin-type processing-associated H-X9-DG protein
MDKQRGFTLSELLIVILVVGVLFFILFPFPTHHSRSRQIACVSNLKQIGLAMLQYSQDYDEHLPLRQAPDGPQARLMSWRLLAEPYAKSTAVYQCPDNPGREWPDIENDGIMRSYAVNSSDGGQNGIGGPFNDRHPGLSLSKIPHPESTILVVESTAAFNDFNPLFPGAFARPTSQGRTGHLFAGHTSESNFLFTDGHAKWKKPLDTLLSTNGANPWTIDGSPYSTADLSAARSTLSYAVDRGPK